MSLYEEGSTIRPILKKKIEILLEGDTDLDMVNRLIPLLRLLKEISPTMEGEERKDLNILNMTVTTIYSNYYSFMTSIGRTRAQSIQNSENLELIDKQVKKFVTAINGVSETFLISLKEVISTAGSKDRAAELFENTYDSLVENVLNKFTM